MDETAQATAEEEALAYLIPWLKRRVDQQPGGNWRLVEPFGFDIYHDLLREKLRVEPVDPTDQSVVKEKLPLLNAIWDLCVRGILRPGAVTYGSGGSSRVGNQFALTAYGLQWLQKPNLIEAIPIEYGRFSQLLARHDTRFGDAYRLRAQEAIRCYEAHTYFACCAMCGAAAESILLTLATGKMGEQDVLRDYQRSGGRNRIRSALVGQAKAELQNRFDNYLELLNYWRDESAHGIARTIGEEEAFTSLLLLLRFAQLGDTEWSILTNST